MSNKEAVSKMPEHEKERGVVYILTNPSFPEYVKIGYASNVEHRLKELNRSECVPFAFRLYAYYKTPAKLADIAIHNMIDSLNLGLRSIEEFDGKQRKREFYKLSPSEAYSILVNIAQISGTTDNLVLVEPSAKERAAEEEAEETRVKRAKLPKLDWMIEQGLVHVGDKICVISHPEEVATIVSGKEVEYRGERMTLNVYGCKVTGWSAIQTYAYMRPVDSDKTLADLREARMLELEMDE